uniref:BCL2 antagonist/killer 1 n=1 Tax=Cavia porcellus TaxID=10141 RepID=H0UT71_CAVPO
MASDQGPGPLREGCGGASPLSEEEQQVVRDTEEVFQSYVYHRHQQDRGGTQGRVPRAHPTAHCCFLSSTLTQVGCQLAIIGDDINRRYGSDIEAMLQQLQPTADNAPDLFYKIACSLFKPGPTWGRVVALLAFGYRLALHVYQQHGLSGFLGKVTRLVVDSMLQLNVVRWIVEKGGWVAALDWAGTFRPIWTVVTAFAIVMVGQYVIRRFFKSS